MVPEKRIIDNCEILIGICKECNKELEISNFDISRKSNNKIYYRSSCHNCYLLHRKKYRKENNQQNINYKINNKDKIKNNNHLYYLNNKDRIKEINKKNYKIYKKEGKTKEYSRNNRIKNKDKINARISIKSKIKRKENIGFAMSCDISRSIRYYLSLNGSSKKNISYRNKLPFTIENLKIHLESKFESWMTWQNRGFYKLDSWNDEDQNTWTWQIDHIIPQSFLPYSSMDDENFKKCWSLDNLRPLSAKQNVIDGNRR